MKFINPTDHTMEVPIKNSATSVLDSINLAPNGGRAEPPPGFEFDSARATKAMRESLVILNPQPAPAPADEETS